VGCKDAQMGESGPTSHVRNPAPIVLFRGVGGLFSLAKACNDSEASPENKDSRKKLTKTKGQKV
jgi:hypothetical protein